MKQESLEIRPFDASPAAPAKAPGTLCDVDELELLDWKRHVFAAYADVRAADDHEAAWREWRRVRDQLFRGHPQSPLSAEGRAAFGGLAYFDYDPAFRVLGEVAPGDDAVREVAASGGEVVRFRRFGAVRFELEGSAAGARALLARRLWRRRLPPVHRRHVGRRHLRRGPVPAGHGQGRRPGRGGRPPRPRLQLRLQPVVLVRPALGLPAQPAREPAAGRRPRGRAAPLLIDPNDFLIDLTNRAPVRCLRYGRRGQWPLPRPAPSRSRSRRRASRSSSGPRGSSGSAPPETTSRRASLALLRVIVAGVVLGLMVAVKREPFPAWRNLPAVAVCGLLWFAGLQLPAERRRAADRRRHGGDARQPRPDPDRAARRGAARRGLPARALPRLRDRVRRRRVDRGGELGRRPLRRLGHRPLPGGRALLRRRRDRPEDRAAHRRDPAAELPLRRGRDARAPAGDTVALARPR